MPRKSKLAHQSYGASWADDMAEYTRQKSHSAPVMEPVERFSRKTGTGRQQQARNYDVVTCVASSPKHAADYASAEQTQQTERISRAVKKELDATSRGYDLLTMRPKYGLSKDDVDALAASSDGKLKKPNKKHPPVYDFNILNNQALTHPKQEGEIRKPSDEGRIPKKHPVVQRPRNIINHRYVKDHEERTEEDHQKMVDHVNLVASRSNKLNPLTQKFTHVDEEADAVTSFAKAEEEYRDKVKNHTYNVSNIVARSEGHAFDIVTNHVYNPNYVLKLEQNNAKGVIQRASQRQSWEYQRDVEEATRDNDAERSLKRISTERMKETQRRGHHVLTNQPFGLSRQEESAGKTVDPTLGKSQAKPPLPMSVLKHDSVMQRLHHATEPRAMTTTSVLRENGPRTTYERVFNSPPTAIASTIASFEGRQKLLLPTIDKCTSEPQMRQQFGNTV